jgi:hypothetical protein
MSPFGKGGYEIGAMSAGGALEMVRACVQGEVKKSVPFVPARRAYLRADSGYALVHPWVASAHQNYLLTAISQLRS